MEHPKARDLMSPVVHHVSPEMRLVDLEADLTAHRISGAPVLERGAVIGIVSRSDIEAARSRERSRSAAVATWYYELDPPEGAGAATAPDPTAAALERLRTLQVRDVMTREVISVSPDESVVHLAQLMAGRRIHRVLVVDDGKLQGIVSSLDIVAGVAKQPATTTAADPFLAGWHRLVAERDLEALGRRLAPDVAIGAPPYWQKLHGHALVHHLLGLILHTIEGFTYHREWRSGNELALEFSGRVGEHQLQGIDLITLNGDGLVQNLDVLIRPHNAVSALIDTIRPRMLAFLSQQAEDDPT